MWLVIGKSNRRVLVPHLLRFCESRRSQIFDALDLVCRQMNSFDSLVRYSLFEQGLEWMLRTDSSAAVTLILSTLSAPHGDGSVKQS